MNIGAIIQYYRTKKGLTQKRLADGICSVSYLSKIENETIEPKEDVAEMLFDRLDVSYEDLAHNDIQKIIRKILKLQKRIKEKDYEAAEEFIQELKRILTPFHATEALNLFQLIHLYYNIQIRQTEEVNRLVENVIRLEEQFTGDHQYTFQKIIGLYHNFKAQPNKAITYFESAKKLSEELNIKDPEIYYLLAVSLTRLQKPAESNYYCQLAKDQFESDFLYTNVTDCYILFGINYMILEAYEVSERYFFQVLNSKPMGDLASVQYRVHHNMAILYYHKKEYDKSMFYLEKLNQQDYYLYEKIQSYYIQAKIHYLKGNPESATTYLIEGEKALREKKYLKYYYQFYVLRHQIAGTITNQDFIDKVENVILPYFIESGEKKMIKELTMMLGDINYEKGDYQLAADYYKYFAKNYNQIKDDV